MPQWVPVSCLSSVAELSFTRRSEEPQTNGTPSKVDDKAVAADGKAHVAAIWPTLRQSFVVPNNWRRHVQWSGLWRQPNTRSILAHSSGEARGFVLFPTIDPLARHSNQIVDLLWRLGVPGGLVQINRHFNKVRKPRFRELSVVVPTTPRASYELAKRTVESLGRWKHRWIDAAPGMATSTAILGIKIPVDRQGRMRVTADPLSMVQYVSGTRPNGDSYVAGSGVEGPAERSGNIWLWHWTFHPSLIPPHRRFFRNGKLAHWENDLRESFVVQFSHDTVHARKGTV